MLAIVAPGQGAQKSGYLAPWLELTSFAARLAEASEAAELDLAELGVNADDLTIRDTKIAQPLLVASALLTAVELTSDSDKPFGNADIAAGHSVGEIAAAAGVGVLSLTDAMKLVGVRGRAMAEAATLTPTTMAAVLGGKADEVVAAIEALGATAANNNGAGQIVAAGTVPQIEALIADPPARTRVIQLSVAGAFHTVHMAPAKEALQACVDSLDPADPQAVLLTNRDGSAVTSGKEYCDQIVRQVANPVRWDLCMETMATLGVTGVLELAPAGTLTGISKRNLKGVATFNLNTPDELDAAKEFVAEHAGVAA